MFAFWLRGWARYCGDAVATGHVNKVVGDFTARRRSTKARLGKNECCEEARLQKAHGVHNTMSGGRGHMEHARRMRTVAVSKQVHHHTPSAVS